MLKIHILCENYTRKRDLLAEHGLSIWIETDEFNILFDTGQTDVYSLNAKHMGIDISKADMLVLSHGHYDHTGGVPEFCRINKKAPIYIHKKAFQKRYHYFENENRKEIGSPWIKEGFNEEKLLSDRFIKIEGTKKINENIIIAGDIPRTVHFENLPKDFYIDDGKGNLTKDIIADEQMLIIKGQKGIYVFSGCSHPGIINCVKQARKIFPDEKIAGVIGGMHLYNVSRMKIKSTIQSIVEFGIQNIIPMHCTGIMPICEMKRYLKQKCKVMNAGDELVFED